MVQIKFIKTPGYIYDLFYIFSLYFNREEHLSSDVNANSVEADSAFQNQIIQDFSPISDEIELFFTFEKIEKVLSRYTILIFTKAILQQTMVLNF